jgi:hypothetical protein
MAQSKYQNVGTPAFYVDYFQWAFLNDISDVNDIVDTSQLGIGLIDEFGNVFPMDTDQETININGILYTH